VISRPSHLRIPNPHLGAYYGIITSAFVSLAVMVALGEQLGAARLWLAYGMLLLPLGLYVIIAAAAHTLDIEDYFVSGRRVPPVFNGFVLATVAAGGTGYFAYTGTTYLLGFDALAIGLAWAVGLFAATVLFTPFLRKSGAYTLPSFLGHRFRSRSVRITACVLLIPPTAMLLVAELKAASVVAALFLPFSEGVALITIAAVIVAIALFGGMRSVTWSGSVGFLVGAIGIAVPLTVVAVLVTNLPAPQLTYGETFPSLQNLESILGLGPAQTLPFGQALPIAQPSPSAKPFLQAFGMIGPFDMVALFLCLVIGTASLPSLLTRSGVTPSTSDQRRSGGWAVLFVSIFAMTAPCLAAFAKVLMLQDLAQPGSSAPGWLTQLNATGLGFVRDANGDGTVSGSELFVARDAIALVLPMAANLPFVCTLLMAAGGMGVAIAAASNHLFTIGGSVAEDIIRIVDRSGALPRLTMAWVATGAVGIAACVFLMFADIDLLRAAIAAFAFAGATFFPVLVLAIWWRRFTKLGAIVAMGTGFAVMVLDALIGGLSGTGPLQAPLACLIGASLSAAAGVAGSLFGPDLQSAEESYFEDLRDPAGEAIYDRAQRRIAAPSN
jgi:cation/acetate symporter